MSALEYVRTRSVLNSRTSCSRWSGLARRQLAPIAIRVVCAKSKWGRIFVSTRLASVFGLPAWMSLSWRIAASTSVEMVLTSASGVSSSAGEAGAARASTRAAVLRVLRMEFKSFDGALAVGTVAAELAPGLLTTLCQEHAFHVDCRDFFPRLPSHHKSGAPIRAPGNRRIAARTSPHLREVRSKVPTADLSVNFGSTGASNTAGLLASGGAGFFRGHPRTITDASSTKQGFFMPPSLNW